MASMHLPGVWGRDLDPVPWTPNPLSWFTHSLSLNQQAPLDFKPGGSFVEVEERVIVRQAMGTLIAFKPDYQHSTSCLFGAHNRICSINFSSRILEAFNIAKEKDQVIVKNRAGEGDCDDY